ncbi:hypothetical protein [Salinisphaera sp. Q1T1-3]|uniref:hypothetical protein n=1 Tax=Salinisphaera sp. Q1T1-3 TaxID=2321229 RepID=UPI0011C41F6A|nr:hypothetical protein [Salinisphaera sp. Q1T1-3]
MTRIKLPLEPIDDSFGLAPDADPNIRRQKPRKSLSKKAVSDEKMAWRIIHQGQNDTLKAHRHALKRYRPARPDI